MAKISSNYSHSDDEKAPIRSTNSFTELPQLITINTRLSRLIGKIDQFNDDLFQCQNFCCIFFPCKTKREWKKLDDTITKKENRLHQKFQEIVNPFGLEYNKLTHAYRLTRFSDPQLDQAVQRYSDLKRNLNQERAECRRMFSS